MLMTHAWPKFDAGAIDAEADGEINWLIDLINEIRSIRSEMNVPGSARAPLVLTGASDLTLSRLQTHKDLILFLGRLSEVKASDSAPAGAVPFVAGEATAHLAVAEFIDLKAEEARLTKGIAEFDKTIIGTSKKLDNADFVARAPEEVIEENRERLTEAQNGKAKLAAALERLKAAL
jgi:valyl-tRNA synthetase